MPRNIEPAVGDLDSVYLYNVDDLEQAVAEGSSGRAVATERAEKLVAEELSAFKSEESAQKGAGPTIVAMRERYREVATAELERSLGGKLKHLGPDDRAALEAMLDALTNKLLHPPTAALRQAAAGGGGDALLLATRTLFALDAESGGGRKAGGHR